MHCAESGRRRQCELQKESKIGSGRLAFESQGIADLLPKHKNPRNISCTCNSTKKCSERLLLKTMAKRKLTEQVKRRKAALKALQHSKLASSSATYSYSVGAEFYFPLYNVLYFNCSGLICREFIPVLVLILDASVFFYPLKYVQGMNVVFCLNFASFLKILPHSNFH